MVALPAAAPETAAVGAGRLAMAKSPSTTGRTSPGLISGSLMPGASMRAGSLLGGESDVKPKSTLFWPSLMALSPCQRTRSSEPSLLSAARLKSCTASGR